MEASWAALGIWSWENNGGIKSQGTRWAKCRPYFSCCMHREDIVGSRGRSPGRSTRRGICVVLQKWRLIRHILACISLPKGTLLPPKCFFLGAARGQGQGHEGSPVPSLLWRRPWEASIGYTSVADNVGLSSFKFYSRAPWDAGYCATKCAVAVQGHPRLLTLVLLENACNARIYLLGNYSKILDISYLNKNIAVFSLKTAILPPFWLKFIW